MIQVPLEFVPFAIIGAAFGISISLSSIAYMLGSALGDERIKGWARFEVYEIFYSGVLGVLIASSWAVMIGVSDDIAKSLDPQGYLFALTEPDHEPIFLTMAQTYMREIYGEIAYLYTEISKVTSVTMFMESISYSVGVSQFEDVGGMVGFGLCPLFYGPFNFLMQNITEMLIRVGVITVFQAAILGFIKSTMPAFIGFGFALRIPGPTRKLGGLMMAIGLMLYFVLPMFYVFGSGIYHSLDPAKKHAGMRIAKFNSYFGTVSIFGNSIEYDKEFDEKLKVYEEYIKSGKLEEMDAQELEESLSQNLQETQKEFYGFDISFPGVVKAILDYLASLPELVGNLVCISRVSAQAWNYGVLSPFIYDNKIFISEIMFEMLANLLFFTTVFSFMALMAIIAGIKGLSPLLGGDVEIAGLTHFI
ncbi:MAG: hypothetical protein QXY05_00105 [Candidatus Anstonellales archaeon]